jgi:hypothetical protein
MAPRLLAIMLAVLLVVIVVMLARLQCLGWDGSTNADGVSYLDLASRYAAGDWRAIGNGYWSPLYPMLLGAAERVARTLRGSSYPEMGIVFAVNVVLFAIVALAFARLAAILLAPISSSASLPLLYCRLAAAGALCIWALIRLVGATTITPDGLLGALLFLVAAELVSAANRSDSAWRDLRFGGLLALGYWTKAVFFPVAIVAAAVYVVVTKRSARWRVGPRLVATMVLLSAPLIVAQSRAQGRPSFGETGRLNYRWYVGGVARAIPIAESVHATRQRRTAAVVALASAPGAMLFTGGVHGSFPYWYDPSRYEPADVGALSVAAQWRALTFNAHWLRATAGILFGMAAIALLAAAPHGRSRWTRLVAAIPAVTMLGLYLLTHPEGRMGAASLASVLLAMITLFDVGHPTRRRPLIALECAALALLAVFAIGHASSRLPRAPTAALAEATSLSLSLSLSRSIRAAGLTAGDRVAIVGDPFGLRWAHETGTLIVAVIPLRPDVPLTGETFAAVARESAARGVPLSAIVYPAAANVRIARAVRAGPSWWIWNARP